MTHTVGIIGLGMIGEKMLEEFLKHPAFTVAACWDLNSQICSKVKANYPQAPVVSNGDQVIEHPDTEIIYIATPPITHVDYGFQVLNQNKALFMEKPLAFDLEESRKLVEYAEKKGIPTTMNFGYAAGPIVDKLEHVIAKKEIGSIKSIEVRYQFPSWPLPNQLSAASWIINKNTGGMVREMFSHHVYLIHRLLGKLSIQSVDISYPNTEDTAEDFVLASLKTGDIPVRFMGGIGSPTTPRDSDFTLNGENRSIRISEGQQLLLAKDGDWLPFPYNTDRTAVEARLDQVGELLEGKISRLPTLRDGFEVQKVIEDLLAQGN
jgi:predicted dehydrogenase